MGIADAQREQPGVHTLGKQRDHFTACAEIAEEGAVGQKIAEHGADRQNDVGYGSEQSDPKS